MRGHGILSVLRIAVVGAGNHSELHHGTSLRDHASKGPIDIELAAVCDLQSDKAERYARQFGFRNFYTSTQEMLDREQIDALVAVTPLDATRSVVGELLSHQIPILLEKPPGQDSGETRELLDIANEYQTPNMVSFNRRFVPSVRTAAEWIDQSEPSRRPYLLIARMLRNGRGEENFIIGTAIHLVDTVHSFFGNPVRVEAKRSAGLSGGSRCEAYLEFAEERTAIIAIEPVSGVNEESYEIIGPDYRVYVETQQDRLVVHDRGNEVANYVAPAETPRHIVSGCYDETGAFLAAVAGKRDYSPKLSDAVLSMTTAESLDRG